MNVTPCSPRPILEPCRLESMDYQVDPYVGCGHRCHYCYALDRAESDWSEEIFIQTEQVLDRFFAERKAAIEEILFDQDHPYFAELKAALVEVGRAQQLDLRIHV